MAHRRCYSDDKSSMQSTHNSNGDTALTELTQPQADRPGSPDPCRPRSRDHNPVQFLPFHPKPQSAILSSVVSNVEGRGQSVAVNFGRTEISQHNLPFPNHNETEVMNTSEKGDSSEIERSISANSQDILALHAIGGMFDKTLRLAMEDSETFTCSDDSSDEDLDLEQFADDFLSEKFGISLNRLRRPGRIINAFQQVRNKCADVLEDEGHRFMGSTRSEDIQSEPNDGGDAYHSGHGDRSYSTPSSSFAPNGTKRPHHDTVDSGGLTGPGTLVKRKRQRKCPIRGDLSCPFRKRNPRRFSVRDYPDCANKSYKNISDLKKHIINCHTQKEPCVCVRCNKNYRDLFALGEHMKQCPYPPPNRPPIQYTDPEDGIDVKTENILTSRKLYQQINNWITLWALLFPADPIVPRPDYEPVVEDHDLIYKYKCNKSQIVQHLDELDLGPSPERVKSSLFEVIENLFRRGGFDDQSPTPSSNSSTSQAQPSSNEKEIATLEKENNLAVNSLLSPDIIPQFNPGELRPSIQLGIRNALEVDEVADYSSTNAVLQPFTQYHSQVIPDNQNFIGLLAEPTQPLDDMTQRIACPTSRNIGLDMLQSSTQPQSTLFHTETLSFNQNRIPQTQEDDHWVLNNEYPPIESDTNMEWHDSSGDFGYWNINNAEC
ncbi:hypothetical protein F5Y09DRAFT_300993 [Xylaria sp. FL1042]|nr:hypothetical protein F5Y09DRAFT_300993 [Xylaria sp. FL1042]